MEKVPLYHRDPRRRSVSTRVVRAGTEQGRPWAVLQDELFYPEGGGQPADRGEIGGVSVLDVRRVGQESRLILAGPVETGPVEACLDWARRLDHMQQHTGQHLLSALAEDRLGWRTTAFHLGEAYSAVELDARPLPAGDLERLEDLCNEAIREARPVRARLVTPGEMEGLPVRTRGLPEGAVDRIRLVGIEGLDLNTCGGTHCRDTAEIQALRLVGTEPMRGGTRLRFLAGGRVLAAARAGEEILRELKDHLGCGPEEFARVVERRAAEARTLRRRAESAERELARLTGRDLARGPDPRVVHVARGRDASFLRALASSFLEARPGGAAVLLAEDGAAAFLLVVAGEGSGVDAAGLGGALIDVLGGRGGGRGGTFQGRGPDPGAVERAAVEARRRLGLPA